MYGYWLGMNFIWWIVWIAVLAAFFAFLTPVPRAAARSSNDPLSILKRRYAAGEITSAEFDERRARLLDETSPRHDAGWRADAPPPRRTISDERGAHH